MSAHLNTAGYGPGVARWFGLGRPRERRWRKGAVWAVIVAGEYRDRANDADVPVPDELPGPRDSDGQQCDQPASVGERFSCPVVQPPAAVALPLN
jgi:hypothetical protein